MGIWYPVIWCLQAVPAFILPATSFPLLNSPPPRPVLFNALFHPTQHTRAGFLRCNSSGNTGLLWCSDLLSQMLRFLTAPFSPPVLCFSSMSSHHVAGPKVFSCGTHSFLTVLTLGCSEGAAVCTGWNLCPRLPFTYGIWHSWSLITKNQKPFKRSA